MRRVFIPHSLTQLPEQLPVGRVQTLHGTSMGTTWAVKFVEEPELSPATVEQAIQGALDGVVAQMSTWLDESDISRFNRARPGSWHDLPEDFYRVLDCALATARSTGGAFDPTVAPLVNLWGFGPQQHRQRPFDAKIKETLSAIGWQKLLVEQSSRRLQQPGGVSLDFSGIAKGYGVDKVCVALRQLGISHYLVELGGELAGVGVKPDGYPWWVALERPQGSALGEAVIALHGLSIATSGDYRRYFELDGQRYAHTIDPQTGYPLKGAPQSVTVLHAECMQADALATALLVMGLSAGLAYAEEHGIAAVFIDSKHGTEHFSSVLSGMLT